jgi:hypothetical protein
MCKRADAERGKPRRQANKVRLGRHTRHWRELSFLMIRRHRRMVGPICPVCGGAEDENDFGSKLTLDLVRGGDHSTALESECQVKCRRCHGREQGGRGAVFLSESDYLRAGRAPRVSSKSAGFAE